MACLPLPIDPLLPDLVASLRDAPNAVLLADPGAGKTTRVPRALLEAGLLERGECWVLEPRRLAARMAAARVAEELGQEAGGRVGYAVRFEQRVSRETRIRFVTEGLLLRRFQEDPDLSGIACVILDEFHERHLQTDLALALLRRLQRGTRPELRILAMSATLDPAPVAAFLEAPILRSEGRTFPVETRHLPRPDGRPLPFQVASALEGLYGADLRGHTLVFLPGAAEIRACLKVCAPLAERLDLRLLPLHGSLSFEAQKEAVAPSRQPKVILSTNVAESSVTIEGVAAVVDSGLGREAFHSPWSGLSGLRTARISRARCVQRAGRAGRTGPGLCLRLFTEAEFDARETFDAPEILRADLAEATLLLHSMGIAQASALPWLEAPPAEALEAASTLLTDLGALDGDASLRDEGRRMAALPLHPRLARLVTAGDALGIPHLARLSAVLLESGGLENRQDLDVRHPTARHRLDCDLFARLDPFLEVETAGFAPGACRSAGLDPSALAQVRRALRALEPSRRVPQAPPPDEEKRLLEALLLAFPDRVARVGAGGTLAFCKGGGGTLAPESRVRDAACIVALEASAMAGGASVTLASRIEPEWLLEHFPERIRDTETLALGPNGRVERRSGLWYGQACLDESRRPAQAGEPGVAAILAEALLERGLGEAGERLLERAAFLRSRRPDLGIPDSVALRRMQALRACEGCTGLPEAEKQDWGWLLREGLGVEASGLLEKWAPEAVRLPGRRVRVHYDGESPWIESRLQDFLGMKEGPRIADSLPLVLHLLAPNGRAVQITTDLAGFWERAYRELRPQLSRRYPRHSWPEADQACGR